MAYSSVKAMLNVSRQNNQPLWDVILQSDLLESGLTRPQSLAEMHHLWQVMVQTSDNYCGADRSASGFAGGDAAKVAEAEARGQLLDCKMHILSFLYVLYNFLLKNYSIKCINSIHPLHIFYIEAGISVISLDKKSMHSHTLPF